MMDFWSEALHYTPREPAEELWVVLKDPQQIGPNISLEGMSKRREGKRGWMHLDLYTENKEREVKRLLSVGAREYPWRYTEGADYTVLQDPDGNLFCVVQK